MLFKVLRKTDVSAKRQFFIFNVLMIVFGITIGSLTSVVLVKLKRSHQHARASHQVTLLALRLKGLVAEKGDAIKSLLIDPLNKPEVERKQQLDAKVTQAFAEMASASKGTILEAQLKKLDEFVNGSFKSNEAEIMADLLANKKDDANFKFVIQYFPLRRSLEKDVDAFAAEAQGYADARGEAINQSVIGVAQLVLGLQIAGISILTMLLMILSRSLVRRLQGTAQQLVDASNSIRTRTSGQVASTRELAEEMIQAAAALREMASAAEQVDGTVARNAEMAETSKRLSEKGRQTLEKGQLAVEELIEAIAGIQSNSGNMKQELEGSFRELEKIIELFKAIHGKTMAINEIVLQTRLLSFNASVEASRAGEHGRGFAVVAEEVGKLARLSGQSALEIEGLLQSSSTQVSATITSVRSRLDILSRSSAEQVEDGAASAERCREAFTSILADVSEIDERIADIFHSSQEQAVGVREIAKSVQHADLAIQKNSERAKFGATQTEEIQSQAATLDHVVEDMEKMIFGAA